MFKKFFGKFKAAVKISIDAMKYFSVEDLSAKFVDENISALRAQNICEILIASIIFYRKNFSKGAQSLFAEKTFPNGKIYCLFNTAVRFYFAWVEKIFVRIVDETGDGKFYIDDGERYTNQILNSVSLRHKISVAMLTYIYEGDFDNEKIWDLSEDYFLGKIPDEVRHADL